MGLNSGSANEWLWPLSSQQDHCHGLSLSMAFSPVSKSVPVSLFLRILLLTGLGLESTFPFPSLLSLLNWHLTFFSTWIHRCPPRSPFQIPHLEWMGFCCNCAGKTTPSSLLATSSGFWFIFFCLWFPCHVHQTSLGGKDFVDQLRNLGVIRLLMNNTTREYSWTGIDMTGRCFREVFLQVNMGGLNWKESEGQEKAVERRWQIMNNQVETKGGWNGDVTKEELDSVDDILILKILKKESRFWNFSLGEERGEIGKN